MLPEHYHFVNEGVASIVFSCHHGNLNGRVLRIPKQPYHDAERDDQARQRITAVFSALFGHEYILSEEVLLIPCYILRIMIAEARSRRSSIRIRSFDIENIPESGSWPSWVMDDMTRINAMPSEFTIELKPKWGFLLNPGEYKSSPVQSRVCRNCIYQCLKQKQGRVASISRYCPLDLFHSSESRRRRALIHLLETPQNNLVVFSAVGEYLSETKERPISNPDLIELVATILKHHLDLIGRIQRSQRLTNLTLGQVQEIISELDPDQWQSLVQDPLSQDLTDRIRADPQYGETSDLHDYPDCLQDPCTYIATMPDPGDTGPVLNPIPVDDPVTTLRLLLLEMTARDISLMMTFSSVPDDADMKNDVGDHSNRPGTSPIRIVRSAGRQWRYKIAVVDLETKYPKKIQHWIDVENNMLAHFAALCQSSSTTA